MSELSPPQDSQDLPALSAWATKIGQHFADLGHNEGRDVVKKLVAALNDDAPKQKKIDRAISQAALVLTQAGLQATRDNYQALIAPTEKLLGEVKDPAEQALVKNAAQGYRTLVSFLDQALAALAQGGPEGKAAFDAAMVKAQEVLGA